MQHTSTGGLVLNNAATVESLLQVFTSNASTKLVRNDKMAGRDYVVVPMVMIVEGVLNGSKGALLYTADEMRKPSVVANWNMKPVVVNHPEQNGIGVSACDPDILTKYQVGVIMNTRFEAGDVKTKKPARLVAEAWLDPIQANAVDERIMKAVEKKKTLELSTGLFTENEANDGEFNGKKYDAIARNYKADHLAILPDKIGACSVSDGAGFIRNELGQVQLSQDMIELATRHTLQSLGVNLTDNSLSFSSIQSQIYGILREKLSAGKKDCPCDYWVEEVFADAFIYSHAGKLFGQKYSVTDTKVELDGGPEEVVRSTQYKSANTGATFVGNLQQNTTMNKQEMIAFLLANATSGFTANSKSYLEGCDDATLQKFVDNVKKASAPAAAPATEPKKETVAANAAPAPAAGGEVKTEPKKPLTVNEYIASAPEGMRDVLEAGLLAANAEKEKAIATIIGNKGNKFTKEHLATLNLATLQGMAALCANNEPAAPARPPMFYGQAPVGGPTGNAQPGGAPANNASQDEVLTLPTMNFEKAAK